LNEKGFPIPFGETGFPLAILGQPQPQQARFYQAKNKAGDPLDPRIEKEKAYSDLQQGLRGRKVYPHHKGLPDNYWDDPNEHCTQQGNNGIYQEYRRPKKDGVEQRDDQNRSLQAWVKPNVPFQFTIDLINLSPFELGALLWLLSLPNNHYHRLGGGKPLGFGSVRLAIDWYNTDLRKGQDWKQYYRDLAPNTPPDSKQAESCIEQFKQAISEVYGNGNNFEQVTFIAAFCRAAQGFEDELPIHYPRTQPAPHPESKIFDWFVDNEKVGKGRKLSLPSLVEDQGLPFNPSNNNPINSKDNRKKRNG
jgi:CRISPR-associated protein (TIGR03986 family)